MPAPDTAALHGQFAADYDRLTQDYQCYAAEVLFGLAYEYTRPGQRLLDLGIGTGLSAAPFAQAGLLVWGVDVSPEMLAVCQAKHLAVELRVADLSVMPWPHPPAAFDQVLACGLLHFFDDLDAFFQAVVRVLRPGGHFTFTTQAAPEGGPPRVRTEAQGLAVYQHTRAYVAALTARHGLAVRKAMRFMVGAEQAGPEAVFYAYVAQAAPPN